MLLEHASLLAAYESRRKTANPDILGATPHDGVALFPSHFQYLASLDLSAIS